jgi:signal transduction histidine kinase
VGEVLIAWQEQDTKTADSIHLAYFYQFIVFSLFIVVMAGAVWMLGRALTRARLRERQSAGFSRFMVLAQEAERSRISRELHDTAAQELRYLSLQMGKLIRSREPKERELIAGEAAALQNALAERVRAMCANLSPPDLRSQSIGGALRRLCWDWSRRTGIECGVSINDTALKDLGEEKALQCFRLVQESLTNIEKHAGAAGASLSARQETDAEGKPVLLLCVSDNGRGFTPPPKDNGARLSLEGRWGIRNMYERCAILGGTLDFESEKGEGTLVKITVPLG